MIELFNWSETAFDTRLTGSAIRRIGHTQWLRDIDVALSNAPASSGIISALQAKRDNPSSLVREHVAWALTRQCDRAPREQFPSALDPPERVREPGSCISGKENPQQLWWGFQSE